MSGPRIVRAPRGTQLTCKSWLTEAVYRMIQNNLDPEVAERPDDLVVYGGRGRAARSWEAFDAILESLRSLENDETLLVQSGKPVAVFKSHTDAPRVLISNSNLVPHWATWKDFDELAQKGLIMYGQMTAGSWIYIGTQGILQGTYETLASLAVQKGWPSLKGKFVLTAGLGGMGGAQPLAITMNEGVGLCVEVDPERAERRRKIGYVDVVVDTLEEAMTLVEEARDRQTPRSIALIGNAADIYPELALRGVIPDVVTDQTPAHDPLFYIPSGYSVQQADELRKRDPQEFARLSRLSMARHVEAMLAFQKAGAEVFDLPPGHLLQPVGQLGGAFRCAGGAAGLEDSRNRCRRTVAGRDQVFHGHIAQLVHQIGKSAQVVVGIDLGERVEVEGAGCADPERRTGVGAEMPRHNRT